MAITTQIENKIIAYLHEKDKRAIELIFSHYRRALFGVIVKVVGEEKLAEDAFQESLVKMWQKGESYDPAKGRLFTWLLNICRNTAIDKKRSQQSREKKNIPIEKSEIGDHVAVSEEMNVNLIGLKEVVETLDSKYRELLELVYFQGYTMEEAAIKLNVPEGTAKTRIRTIIRKLRTWANQST